MPPYRSNEELLNAFRENGINSRLCPGEADVEIARLSKHEGVAVISSDSDVLCSNARVVFRPIYCQRVQRMTMFQVIWLHKLREDLGLSPEKLRLLAITSGNDFSTNVKHYGIKRNLAIIQGLADDTVPKLLAGYCTFMKTNHGIQVAPSHFQHAFDIFENQAETFNIQWPSAMDNSFMTRIKHWKQAKSRWKPQPRHEKSGSCTIKCSTPCSWEHRCKDDECQDHCKQLGVPNRAMYRTTTRHNVSRKLGDATPDQQLPDATLESEISTSMQSNDDAISKDENIQDEVYDVMRSIVSQVVMDNSTVKRKDQSISYNTSTKKSRTINNDTVIKREWSELNRQIKSFKSRNGTVTKSCGLVQTRFIENGHSKQTALLFSTRIDELNLILEHTRMAVSSFVTYVLQQELTGTYDLKQLSYGKIGAELFFNRVIAYIACRNLNSNGFNAKKQRKAKISKCTLADQCIAFLRYIEFPRLEISFGIADVASELQSRLDKEFNGQIIGRLPELVKTALSLDPANEARIQAIEASSNAQIVKERELLMDILKDKDGEVSDESLQMFVHGHINDKKTSSKRQDTSLCLFQL